MKLLASHLSSLGHLSELVLTGVDSVDDSWCKFNWTQPLTLLHLIRCRNVTSPIFHQLCSAFASTLEDLHYEQHFTIGISWGGRESPPIIEDLRTLPPLVLPALTDLTLEIALKRCEEVPLGAFRKCKNLREITCRKISSSEEWAAIQELFFGNTWPQLEKVHFTTIDESYEIKPSPWELIDFLIDAGIYTTYDDEDNATNM